MRVLAPLVLFSVALLDGCGGGDGDGGCATTADLRSDPAYAGQYAATYTPRSGAIGGSREFRLSVLVDGTVGGFVRNPSTGAGFENEVVGTVLNSSDACGDGATYVELRYTLAGEPQTLVAQRAVEASLTGGYRVRSTDAKTTLGTLTIDAVPTP